MINIEDKLEEIGEYFTNKVIDGDYELLGCNEHIAEIVINGKYNFMLWIGSELPKDLNFFRYSEQRLFEHINIEKDTDKAAALDKLKPRIARHIKAKIEAEKQQKIEKLENILNKTK